MRRKGTASKHKEKGMGISEQVTAEMERRVNEGLDPLTGQPMVTSGVIECRMGQLVDETGREVTLSESGHWIYSDEAGWS